MLPENAVSKAISNPSSVYQWLKEYYKFIPYLSARSINQRVHNRQGAGDLDVMAEDWDVLILIDACRIDYFEDLNTLDGELQKRESPGSMSLEYLNESFVGKELHDTVYVTANPYVGEIPDGTFHDVISHADDYWENDIGTVPPEKMAEATREALDKYPQKRIIAHFMQPHEPFLTDFGQEVSERLVWRGNQYFPGANSATDVRQAYRENIEYVLAVLEDLVDKIDVETVVSSDHGELMGERLSPIPIRGWEHPHSLYPPELIDVPWLRIPGDRRDISSDPPQSTTVDSEVIEQRLQDLGYR